VGIVELVLIQIRLCLGELQLLLEGVLDGFFGAGEVPLHPLHLGLIHVRLRSRILQASGDVLCLGRERCRMVRRRLERVGEREIDLLIGDPQDLPCHPLLFAGRGGRGQLSSRVELILSRPDQRSARGLRNWTVRDDQGDHRHDQKSKKHLGNDAVVSLHDVC